MHRLSRHIGISGLLGAAVALTAPAQADIIFDFDDATGAGGKTVTVDQSGSSSGSLGDWDTGVSGDGGFIGNFGATPRPGITVSLDGVLDAGDTGNPGDHAASIVASFDLTGVAAGNTDNFFTGLQMSASDAGFNSSTASDYEMFARVSAPVGVVYAISLQLGSSSNRVSLEGVGTGQYELIGGSLDTFSENDDFFVNFLADPTQDLRLRVNTTGNAADNNTWTSGVTLLVDDITLSQIPEPGSLALAGLGGLLLLGRRRCR